jgi:Ras family protein
MDSYYPTIESTYAKSVVYKGVEYDCHIIDTAGQVSIALALSFFFVDSDCHHVNSAHSDFATIQKDEFSPINAQHAIGIHGYILVYSITSRNSFNMIEVVHDKIVDFCGLTKIPCVIVGSKCDLSMQ